MRLRRFCHMMAFGFRSSAAFPVHTAVRQADMLPAAYIGFTGSSAGSHADDVATYTIGSTTTNIASHEGTGAGAAYAARDAFLSAVDQNYFYEDSPGTRRQDLHNRHPAAAVHEATRIMPPRFCAGSPACFLRADPAEFVRARLPLSFKQSVRLPGRRRPAELPPINRATSNCSMGRS